jgi:16S rRNA G527 N7-methylase RsmG
VTFLAAANKKSKKQVHLENVQSQQRQLEKFEAQKAAHDAIVAAVEDSRKVAEFFSESHLREPHLLIMVFFCV